MVLMFPVLVLAMASTGCRSGKVTDRIVDSIPQVESICSKPGSEPTWAEVVSSWWTEFQDPELNAMVESVLGDNSSLRAAWNRLEQSGYTAQAVRSQFVPQLSLNGFGGWTRRMQGAGGGLDETETWGASAAASYELDVWRRISAAAGQADMNAQATFYDYETMSISLAASVCDAWFDVNERIGLLSLLKSQLKSSEDNLAAVEERYRRGLGSLLDVYQQRQLAASIRAQIPSVEAAIFLARNRLTVLAGLLPGEAGTYGTGLLPEPPPPVEADIDSFVAEDRPDVLAAFARLGAAERGAALAMRERFPTFRLSTSAGSQAEDTDQLFDEVTGEALLGVSLPLVDGGRRRAETQRARAAFAERLEIYAETVRQAMREIHDARILEINQRETVKRLEEELSATRQTLELSSERYRAGLIDFLNVLTAQSRVYQLERSVISARRQQLSFRVQFCRALAGSDVGVRKRKGIQ
jgi:NodT family efflux transporter outer membrane factor (OMF) lipoprotein